MSSIAVTIFGGRLIDWGYVHVNVTGLMLPDPEVGTDVRNGSSEMSSNISGLNEGLKRILLMLRQILIIYFFSFAAYVRMGLKFASFLRV